MATPSPCPPSTTTEPTENSAPATRITCWWTTASHVSTGATASTCRTSRRCGRQGGAGARALGASLPTWTERSPQSAPIKPVCLSSGQKRGTWHCVCFCLFRTMCDNYKLVPIVYQSNTVTGDSLGEKIKPRIIHQLIPPYFESLGIPLQSFISSYLLQFEWYYFECLGIPLQSFISS